MTQNSSSLHSKSLFIRSILNLLLIYMLRASMRLLRIVILSQIFYEIEYRKGIQLTKNMSMNNCVCSCMVFNVSGTY